MLKLAKRQNLSAVAKIVNTYLFRERALLMAYFRVGKGVHNDPPKWDILEYELLHMVWVKNDLKKWDIIYDVSRYVSSLVAI